MSKNLAHGRLLMLFKHSYELRYSSIRLFFFLATSCHLWDLNSLIWFPALGAWCLHYWITGEVSYQTLLK